MISDKLTAIAENEQKVYDAGRKAEYDAFWDAVQNYGARTDYQMGFRQWQGMTKFDPKYKITATGNAALMFFNCYNMEEINKEKLDLSACENFNQFSHNCSSLKYFPDVNMKPVNLSNAFNNCSSLKYFEALDFSRVTSANMAFYYMKSLEEFREIRGTISIGLDLQWSTLLSKDSIVNIFNVLSSDVTDQTLTLSLTAVNNAFETSEGLADGSTSEEWLNLVATKTNWSIVLV